MPTQQVSDIIQGYRDSGGVRHFTNQGVPEGANIDYLQTSTRIRDSDEEVNRAIDSALQFDVTGATMEDFSRNRDALFQHTFGGRVNDERLLNPDEARAWQANANKLYADLHNQNEQKKRQLIARADFAMKRKDADKPNRISDQDRLRNTVQEMMQLQSVVTDQGARPNERAAAAAAYTQAYRMAELYQSMAGIGLPKQLTGEQVQSIQDTAAATWGALTEGERADYKGFNDYMAEALRKGEKILSGPTLLERVGLPSPGELTTVPEPPVRDPRGIVAARLPSVTTALKKMPVRDRRQIAAIIDAAAARAKQTGDPTALIRIFDEVAPEKKTATAVVAPGEIDVINVGPGSVGKKKNSNLDSFMRQTVEQGRQEILQPKTAPSKPVLKGSKRMIMDLSNYLNKGRQ
jgi:hypothetical protein